MTVHGFPLSSHAMPPEDEVDAFARVLTRSPGGTTVGSGFFIAVTNWQYLVITARHVVMSTSIQSIDIELQLIGGGTAMVAAAAYAFDDVFVPSRDVAVIALYANANTAGLPWGTGLAGSFDATAIGFPASTGERRDLDCTATTHQPTANSTTFFTTNRTIQHGMSGGPLITDAALLSSDETGFGVVGLCVEDHLVIDLPTDIIEDCAGKARAKSNGGSL